MAKSEDIGPVNLLRALKEHQGFHTAVFLTFCADLAFFEEVILYPLWQDGCRNNLVFMDARCYANALNDMHASITWVGQRYVVCPVRLGHEQSFHAKMVLLIGQERGRLLIGSGNLNFNGWGHNCEVYSCLDWTLDDRRLQHVFTQAWSLVNQVYRQWGHSTEARNMLHKAKYVAPWLEVETIPPNDIALLHTLDGPLAQQLQQRLAGETIQKMVVLTPFLDNGAVALKELYQRFSPRALQLVLQPVTAVGNGKALDALQDKTPLQVHRFEDEAHYLHAKAYLFETSRSSYMVTGSANCTRAAMLSGVDRGNFEVVLLRQGEARQHFAYLFKDKVSPQRLQDLKNIKLREKQFPEGEAIASLVQLLDVSIIEGRLSICYRVVNEQTDIACLQLKLSTVPPIFAPLQAAGPGEHTEQVTLSQQQLALLNRPSTASILGQDARRRAVDARCNELWITNVDALRAQMTRVGIAGTRSGDYLNEGVLASDEEWAELYQSLTGLIMVDVAELKRRGGTYTTSPKQKKSPAAPLSERETPIHIVTPSELAGEQSSTEEDIATLLFRESSFYAWFEHVNGRLPGPLTGPSEPGEESDAEKTVDGRAGKRKEDPTHKRKKWTPEERMGRRFTNLVRKYIDSLQNDEYMQSISILHALAYFAVFQRITCLLFDHQVIGPEAFVHLVLDLNTGFFGSSQDRAPAVDPCLRQHIQRIWHEEWLQYEVSLYALASMDMAALYAEQAEDTGLADEVAEAMVQVLGGVATVDVSPLLGNPERFASVANVYHKDALDLCNRVKERFNDLLQRIIVLLDDWNLSTTVAITENQDQNLAVVLRQAQLDYGVARYRLLAQLEEVDTRVRLCPELIDLARRVGDDGIVRWLEQELADLSRRQGDNREVAEALYQEGRNLFYSGSRAAVSKLRQALSIAKRLDDAKLVQDCEQCLKWASFFKG